MLRIIRATAPVDVTTQHVAQGLSKLGGGFARDLVDGTGRAVMPWQRSERLERLGKTASPEFLADEILHKLPTSA